MSAVAHRHHLGARYQTAIVLAFVSARPIVVAPNEPHRHADVSVDGSRCLPTRRVAEQADEGAVTRGLPRPAMIREIAPPMETPHRVTARRSRASRKPSTAWTKKSASYRAFGISE